MSTPRSDLAAAPLLRTLAPNLDEAVLDLLPAAVYVSDADGAIVRFNRRAAAVWGRTPRTGDPAERFCGAHRLYHPDGRLMPHDQTPMAEALRTGAATHDAEVIIEQPDGHRIWAQVNIEPIRNPAGTVVGAINCVQDITDRHRAEAQLREQKELHHLIVETTPECVKIVARDGRLLYMNEAGLRMIGADNLEAVLGTSTFDLIAPEARAEWQQRHRQVCDGTCLSWQFAIVGLDGSRREMETHAAPLAIPGSEVAHLAVTRDISEQRHHERQQQLLVNELNHRVKNTLATVQAVVSQTLAHAGDVEQAREAVDSRLIALARAHDMLTAGNWQGADLGAVVRAALSVHCPNPERLDIEGPNVHLPPKVALSMTMALHELCTNAVKYGALANDCGSVRVHWRVDSSGEADRLVLHWQEAGGPPVVVPTRRGFGSRLIERSLSMELQGEVRLAYPADGAICTIDAPLPAA